MSHALKMYACVFFSFGTVKIVNINIHEKALLVEDVRSGFCCSLTRWVLHQEMQMFYGEFVDMGLIALSCETLRNRFLRSRKRAYLHFQTDNGISATKITQLTYSIKPASCAAQSVNDEVADEGSNKLIDLLADRAVW